MGSLIATDTGVKTLSKAHCRSSEEQIPRLLERLRRREKNWRVPKREHHAPKAGGPAHNWHTKASARLWFAVEFTDRRISANRPRLGRDAPWFGQQRRRTSGTAKATASRTENLPRFVVGRCSKVSGGLKQLYQIRRMNTTTPELAYFVSICVPAHALLPAKQLQFAAR